MAPENESSPTPDTPPEASAPPGSSEQESPEGPGKGRIPGQAYTPMPEFGKPAPRRWPYIVAALVVAAAAALFLLLR